MKIKDEPISKYKFIHELIGSECKVFSVADKKVEIEISNTVELDEILETFEDFLKACGFVIENGEKLAIIREVNEEDNESNLDL